MKLTKSEYRQIRQGPCWICNKVDFTNQPHHIHRQGDPYWEETGRDPNQDFNVRCLCEQCHADWKHFVGEFFWRMRKDLCKALVKRARKKYPSAYKDLIPQWALWIAGGMTVPEPYSEWKDE